MASAANQVRSALTPELAEFARKQAKVIREANSAACYHLLDVGEALYAVRRRLPHGAWLDWLEVEFRWSESHARRLISIYEWQKKLKSVRLTDLPIDLTALYLLASRKTPQGVRDNAVSKAKDGERVTYEYARHARTVGEALEVLRAKTPVKASPPIVVTEEQRKSDHEARERTREAGWLDTYVGNLAESRFGAEELVQELSSWTHNTQPLASLADDLPAALEFLLALRTALLARGLYKETDLGRAHPIRIDEAGSAQKRKRAG